jgi:hypothetical protein
VGEREREEGEKREGERDGEKREEDLVEGDFGDTSSHINGSCGILPGIVIISEIYF